jgi:hypothetical protein
VNGLDVAMETTYQFSKRDIDLTNIECYVVTATTVFGNKLKININKT